MGTPVETGAFWEGEEGSISRRDALAAHQKMKATWGFDFPLTQISNHFASKYCENICIEDIENRLVDTVGMEKLG